MKSDNKLPDLEIRFQPADFVYVYENHNSGGVGRDMFTAVLQNIAFVNQTDEEVKLLDARINVKADDNLVQTHRISQEALEQAAQRFHTYDKQGILDLYDFQFQTNRYLQEITFSEQTTLKPGSAIVITHKSLLFQGLPDIITVTVKGYTVDGETVSSEKDLRIINHTSKNEYIFPVKGRWTVVGAPTLNSHHRWGILQEFALDIAKIGAEGLSHSGDGKKLTQYYAYGEPVYAMCNGKVVSALGNMGEADNNLQQPEESAEEYFERMQAYQQELLEKGFAYTFGNHVILEHVNGEYSRYVHLQHDSVCVKVGDIVKCGQKIGNLGHSGNSTEPHLHFDVADGPDLAYSRSIPVSFKNIVVWPDDDGSVRHLHLGQIVIANEEKDPI